MTSSPSWRNPIVAAPGQMQTDVDPLMLQPSRRDLLQVRLDIQQQLSDAGIERGTPIEVTPAAVIWDGHHAVRVAATSGKLVTVKVVKIGVQATAASIMDLPVN